MYNDVYLYHLCDMSLHFNISANLPLSYFVILFFNYLQGLHVLPSSIPFVIFKNSFILNHEDPRDVPPTTRNNMMYTIHPWVLFLHVHCPSCPNTLINFVVQNQWLGLTSMKTTNLPTRETRCLRYEFIYDLYLKIPNFGFGAIKSTGKIPGHF